MTQTQTERFLAWGRAALAQYPLREPSLSFLGHSDNLTFRVEEPDGKTYLLRLHAPALAYWEGVRQQPEVIASELAWLEALAAEGGFMLQTPVRTRAGELVGELIALDEANRARVTPVTLLTWLAGEHFSPASPDAQGQVERFGHLVARLHDFSTHWLPPAGFTRPSYDLGHFRRIFARLLRGVDLGVFSEEIYWSLRATTQAILDEIEALPDDIHHWGVIHADLHVGNFLVTPGSEDDQGCIIPIDFSFCGFGHYLFDLSVCLAGGLKGPLRADFLRGYRAVRPLAERELRPVDAYALAGTLSYFAYQIDNPAERAWLQRRIPELARGECSRFLQGNRLMT